MSSRFRYAIVLVDEDGTRLAQEAVDVDWEPAREQTRFDAMRRAALGPDEIGALAAVDPLWDEKLGEPFLRAVRVTLRAGRDDGVTAVSAEFTSAYFADLARGVSSRLVQSGQLLEGQRFICLTAAYPIAAETPALAPASFEAEEVPSPIPVRPARWPARYDTASADGTAVATALSVFIPRQVLDDAVALTSETTGRETGGFLLGHLCRDRDGGDLFSLVTAQIPARHTTPSETSLTFTVETWNALRGAMALRHDHEILLGWWHSHPVRSWCADCSVEKQRVCRYATGFFSAQDRALHRTIFPRAYSVALVVNDVAFGPSTWSVFGWRQGVIAQRGFHVVRDTLTPQRRSQGPVTRRVHSGHA